MSAHLALQHTWCHIQQKAAQFAVRSDLLIWYPVLAMKNQGNQSFKQTNKRNERAKERINELVNERMNNEKILTNESESEGKKASKLARSKRTVSEWKMDV